MPLDKNLAREEESDTVDNLATGDKVTAVNPADGHQYPAKILEVLGRGQYRVSEIELGNTYHITSSFSLLLSFCNARLTHPFLLHSFHSFHSFNSGIIHKLWKRRGGHSAAYHCVRKATEKKL